VPLPREEVVRGFIEEMGRFDQLIRSVDEHEWRTPTRCEGWTAADVAAHVTGQLSDVVNGRFEGLGTPEVTRREVDERRDKSPKEMADELAEVLAAGQQILVAIDDAAWSGPAPAGGGTLGDGVEALYTDAWVHGDDIRAALGRPTEPGPGVRVSVSHMSFLLTEKGWGPATIAVDGVEELDVSGGGGQRITGDAIDFVLAATGRIPASKIGQDDTINVFA